MTPFWQFAARLFRRPVALTAALLLAFTSAASMGTGLAVLVPVLRSILGEDQATLPDIIGKAAAKVHYTVPASVMNVLPTGRMEAVVWLLAGLCILTILGATANFLHAYLSLTLSTQVVADVRRDAFRHAIHLPLKALVGKTGDILSRIVNDTNVLLNGLSSLTSKAVAQITKAAAALTVAMCIEWRLTIVAALLAPLLYVIVRKLGKRVRRASRGAMQAQARLLASATEALQGLRVVKVHTGERYELGRFTRHNRDVVAEQFRARAARALAAPLTETVTIIVVAALALVAAKAIIGGTISATSFIGAIAALGIAGAQLKPLTNLIQEIQTSDAAAQRIQQVLDAEPEAVHDRKRGRTPAPRLARHGKSIEFEEVTFRYPDTDAPAIDRATLSIRHGETVAFVGPNGSGKTTLLSLIPRLFEPDSGRVLIDEVDIAKIGLHSLRAQIGAVTQEVVLFHAPIAENIAYGRAGATREQIVEAARRAGADAFIREKPRGYDAVVGEQGLTLSGGQRQKIAIARAILRDPSILILDEATSMVDAESERQIGEALAAFAVGRTCLIVAHRLATVARADRIVVMEAGRIADVGEHHELLERCPTYRLLARTQLTPTAA